MTTRPIAAGTAGPSRPEHLENPTINDLEGGMSSEAVGIDEEAIDAIPASSLPVGANRTEGPGQGDTLLLSMIWTK